MDREKQDRLAKRLLATFQEELGEHIRALNENLLALEKAPQAPEREERLKSLFRAAHSLKGAARSVALRPIEEMCHHLEEVLRSVQQGSVALEAEVFALVYRAADALEDARARIAAGRTLVPGPLQEVAPLLAGIGRGSPRPLAPAVAPPAPATAPTAPPPARPSSPAGPPPPFPAPPAADDAPGAASGGEAAVRVQAVKLDRLLARSGELIVAGRRLEGADAALDAAGEALARLHRAFQRAKEEVRRGPGGAPGGGARPALPAAFGRLEEDIRAARTEIERLEARLKGDRRAVGRAAARVDEEVRRARLLPFAEACEGLERAVRDLAKEKGKGVEVVLEGASIEVDRSILDALRDPLLCLARNAVDHGIEAPEARRRCGKPERGRIVVSAALRGARIEVSVADDGAGVDLDAVRAMARRRGLPEPRDERACVDLLFEPGFSTAARVTEISGRGVGLDIVKNRVRALHGTVDISFEAGRGSRVALALPLTLTTIRALLVAAGGETYAIPGASVVRLLRLDRSEIRAAGGRDVISAGDGPPVPIVSLARVLGLRGREPAARAAGRVPAVVLGAPARAAFAVDELIGEREILVKTLGPRLRSLRTVAGATVLETGKVALILGAAELVRTALEQPGEAPLSAASGAPPAAARRILLADDSVTTRSLERAILEAAGYEVLTAVDGEDAWRMLKERGADLVVSDIDMPRMDGLTLCRTIRGAKRFRDLPVVLVTALESEPDRARGAEAGADAYIVKSGFDQRDLLRTIDALLGGGSP